MDAVSLDVILDDLIGPVCEIADLKPTNEWPEEIRGLIGYARRVRDKFGFEVERSR